MNIGSGYTRRLYVRAWVLYNIHAITMAHAFKQQEPTHQTSWAEENAELDELFEKEHITPVPLGDMLKRVEELEETRVPDEELTKNTTAQEKADLLALFTPLPSSSKPDARSKSSSKGKAKENITEGSKGKKPVIEDEENQGEPDYPESFASQIEFDELKEGFDDITEKYKALDAKLDHVMKERENLPKLLRDMQADLNAQLTLFSSKLYQSLEAQMSKPEVSAALTTIDQIKAEQSDQFRAAAGFLSDEPKATSPIVQKGSTLKNKKRFKAIK